MEMEMKIISKHLVKPVEPVYNGLFPLSELDFVSLTHAYCIYFYDRPIQTDWSTKKIINILKDSLSRVLVPFYPLAGRLSWLGGGRVKLECNSMGAELTQVDSSSTKIADFGDFYSSSEKFQYLVPKMDYCKKPIHELPLLAVQVTTFACGGLSVGFAMSHVVMDGRSAFHFTKEWARLARGEPLEVVPFLDRRLLLAQNVDYYGPKKRDEVVVDYYCNESMNYFREVGYGKTGDNVTPIFKVVTDEEIERLKEVVNRSRETSNDNDGHPYTRFEIIAAYVWRIVCKARELKSEEITTLIVIADARSRMDPPLPLSYFGNASVDVLISCFVGELMSKPLSCICSKIREAIRRVNNKCVFESIELLKSQKSLIKYQSFDDRGKLYGRSCANPNDVEVVSWLYLNCLGVDFGWGKEIYMGAPFVHGHNGDFFIIPHKNDGYVVIVLFLQHASVQNKSNANFLKC